MVLVLSRRLSTWSASQTEADRHRQAALATRGGRPGAAGVRRASGASNVLRVRRLPGLGAVSETGDEDSMGDAGEGLVDAESRLAERMEEREQEKRKARAGVVTADPELVRQLESCRLARTETQRQLEATVHEARRPQLREALAELDRRIVELSKRR